MYRRESISLSYYEKHMMLHGIEALLIFSLSILEMYFTIFSYIITPMISNLSLRARTYVTLTAVFGQLTCPVPCRPGLVGEGIRAGTERGLRPPPPPSHHNPFARHRRYGTPRLTGTTGHHIWGGGGGCEFIS
jgi:hypothetical protein